MGFHRDRPASESEDEGDRAALRSSTGEGGRPGSAGAGRAAQPLQAHGKEAKKTKTMGTMKQTTLMLPPPLPPPDTAKARGNPLTEKSVPTANAREDQAEGEEAKDLREDARKKQVSLALAPSMGKLRTSLGFALPPSTPVARPALPAPASSAARPSTGALPQSQKRVFPAATPSGARALFSAAPTPSGSGSGITKIGPPTGAARTLTGAGRGGLAFGFGGRTSLGMGMGARRGGMATRVLQRASKKSSLPVVIGSPVKGGARAGVEEDVMDVSEEGEGGAGERTTQEKIGDWLRNASKDTLRDLGHTEEEGGDAHPGQEEPNGANGAVVDGQPSSDAAGPPPSSEGEGSAESAEAEREREREARRNASRRASMASQLLSQSLSALPDTPPGPAAAKDKGKGRAVSSSWPLPGAAAEGAGEMPPPPVPPARATRHNTRLATGALASPPEAKGKEREREREKEKGVLDSPGALAVLRGCTIFVDVRTEEGDDAGGLFVDMLRGLGAKVRLALAMSVRG